MSRSLAPFCGAAIAALASVSNAQTIEVEVLGHVISNYASGGLVFGDVEVGDPVSMSYSIDAADAISAPTAPHRRGYVVDLASFEMTVGGVDVPLYPQPTPFYLVLEVDPDTPYSKLHLSHDLEQPFDIGMGLNGPSGFPLMLGNGYWLNEGLITTLDIATAAGSYDLDDYLSSGWGFDTGFQQYIDFSPVSMTIHVVNDCPTDVDASGTTDVADLVAVLLAWGACGACDEDVTGDGLVDVQDVIAVLTAWGACG